MPYMMSFERAAITKGREEGLIEGLRDAIELGLELKFGELGLEAAAQMLKTDDLEVLRRLKADLRGDRTLDELREEYTSSPS